MTNLIFVVAAYLLGSISFAVLMSKAFGLPDPRSYAPAIRGDQCAAQRQEGGGSADVARRRGERLGGGVCGDAVRRAR